MFRITVAGCATNEVRHRSSVNKAIWIRQYLFQRESDRHRRPSNQRFFF